MCLVAIVTIQHKEFNTQQAYNRGCMQISGLRLLLLFSQGCMLAQELDIPVFRSNAAFISVDAQVLSRGNPVSGLKQQDFLVWDNGQRQAITSFGADDQPLDVMLLLDISGSMIPIEQKVKSIAAEAMARNACS